MIKFFKAKACFTLDEQLPPHETLLKRSMHCVRVFQRVFNACYDGKQNHIDAD